MMRVLFLSPRFPLPAWRGDQVRVLHLVRALGTRTELKLLSFGPPDPEPIEGVASRTVSFTSWGRLAANLASPSPRLPGQVRLFLDRGMRCAVAEELDGWRPDVVHATLSRMAPYLPPAGTAHRHLDLVDSLHLNMSERARSSGPLGRAAFKFEAALMKRYEIAQAAGADSSSVVSEADRIAAGLPDGTVIPNGVDLSTFRFQAPAERPPTMIFFGNLGYFHNVEPARFVATEVLSRVRSRLPEARLKVAGARPAASLKRAIAATDAELVDSPPDLIAELRQAAVAVLPMFSGSGIKNKVLEAFALGLPVVANSIGVDGIVGALPGEHYLLGEDADGLAEAAVRLLEQPTTRVAVATAARGVVEERYTWDRQAEAMLALYGA